MAFHWKVLLWMVAGMLLGVGLQVFTDAPVAVGIAGRAEAGVLVVESVQGGGGVKISSSSKAPASRK